MENFLDKQSFTVYSKAISFFINNMSSTYNIRKMTLTDLLVHTRFILFFDEIKLFNCLIKIDVSASKGLLESINRLSKLAYFVMIYGLKILWLYHVHIFY